MKTQIIQLEAHDDVISARDKMGAGQASRILLVWPAKARLLTRRLDLVLLQRYSSRLGAQLGLVTNDEDVRFYANELGLHTFASLRQAQSHRWRQTRRRRVRLTKPLERTVATTQRRGKLMRPTSVFELPWLRYTAFGISLISVLALIAVILPGARITISPHREQQSVKLNVKANPDIAEPLLAGELPVHWATVIVEGRHSLPASGEIRVPEKPATGEVEFINLTQDPVTIPAGTVVTTLESPVIRFTTNKAATVRAGMGQKASVPVLAVVPGASGNLAANRLQAIEGSLGLSLTVNNPKPTRQGSDRPAASPTQADRNRLYQQLSTNLEKTAQNELTSLLPTKGAVDDLPLLPTLQLGKVLEETYTPTPGQPAEQVSLLLRLEFEYQLISATDLQKLAAPILAAGVPAGYQSIPDTLQIDYGQIHLDPAGIASWQVVLRQDIESVVNPSTTAALAHGLTVEQAKEKLTTTLGLDAFPQIQVMPSWWPYLPYLPFRIHVTLQSTGN